MDQHVGGHRPRDVWRKLLECGRVRLEVIQADRQTRLSFKIECEHDDPTDAVGDPQQQSGDRHSHSFLSASVLRQRDRTKHDTDQAGDSEQRRAEQRHDQGGDGHLVPSPRRRVIPVVVQP